MLIEKRILLLNSQGHLYLLLDGKLIDQLQGSPREIIIALERGEYELPSDAYQGVEDVQYITLSEEIDSPEDWYKAQEVPSGGCQGGCGKCCGKH